MDVYLVRKRPFAEHEDEQARQQQRQRQRRGAHSYTSPAATHRSSISTTAGGRSESSAAAAAGVGSSSSAFARASSLRGGSSGGSGATSPSPFSSGLSSSFGSGGAHVVTQFRAGRSAASAPTRQIRLEQLKKVTDLSAVGALQSSLASAHERHDWPRVLSLLRKLSDIFVTKKVLAQTGVGRTVAALKKLHKLLPANTALQPAAADQPRPDQESKQQANQPSTRSDEGGEDEGAIDLTDDGDSHSKASHQAASAPAAAAAHNGSKPPSSTSDLLASIVSLSYRLVETWKDQVSKEDEAASLVSNSQVSLVFADYSTHHARIDTYKALYYRLTRTDTRETPAQKQLRRQASQQLTPRDLPAARLAADLENSLFTHHLQIAQVRHSERAKRAGSELLSAQSSDAEVALIAKSLPSAYTPHARSLLATVNQPDQLVRLYPWVEADAAGTSLAPDQTEKRRQLLQQLVQHTKSSFA